MRTAQVEVRYLASPLAHARIGIIVPRYGHTAVERNVVKRRLRDLARQDVFPALAVCDVVIWATPSAYAASHEMLRAALRKVTPQLPNRALGDAP